MVNCCKKFGYDLEQGTKAFCIVELFMAYVHILNASCIVSIGVVDYFTYIGNHGLKLTFPQFILFLTYISYMVMLYVQAISSVFLYRMGFVQKNAKVVGMWLLIAVFNYICPAILFFVGIISKDDLAVHIPPSVGYFFLYMFYLDIGFGQMYTYYKHLKSENRVSPEEEGAGMGAEEKAEPKGGSAMTMSGNATGSPSDTNVGADNV